MHKRKTWVMILASVGVLVLIVVWVLQYYGILPKRTYSSQHFGIDVVYSSQDYNHNGVDDYTDFLLGAKQDAENHPTYDGRYCAGGYPPEDIGVCTDVVWRAFRQAGYSLRDMVDQDVRQYPDRYPDIQYRDANIDFRRVKNLWAFFQAYALELTCDITDIDQWQPGDIVIFNGGKHIGVVSDLRNRSGQPYILHNAGQFRREEDYLGRSPVEAHFRFDASCVPQEVLVAWGDLSWEELLNSGARFNGSSLLNPDEIALDYSILNGSFTHTMRLQSGDVLDVALQVDEGTLGIAIEGGNGTPLYQNDNLDTSQFHLEISQTDSYQVTITGSNTKGSIHLKV